MSRVVYIWIFLHAMVYAMVLLGECFSQSSFKFNAYEFQTTTIIWRGPKLDSFPQIHLLLYFL
jgi:hypothetical protein